MASVPDIEDIGDSCCSAPPSPYHDTSYAPSPCDVLSPPENSRAGISVGAPDPLSLISLFDGLEIDSMNRHKLSKSTFTYGVQCLKRLYLNKHFRRLKVEKDPLDATTKQLFESGKQVGFVARNLFPGGVDCSPPTPFDYRSSVLKTWSEMRKPTARVIYEAAFMTSDVLAALDILVKSEDEEGKEVWDAYEVKSATKVNDALKLDAALQYWVITNSGVKLRSMNLVTINSSYTWTEGDSPDVNQLFTISDVTEKCISDMGFIAKQAEIEKKIIDAKDVPDVRISPHCTKPYKCDFMGHCWKQAQVPEYSILDLSRGGDKAWDMYNAGWKTTQDVQNGENLTPNQLAQVYADKSKDVLIDRGTLKEFLATVTYPLYHLDFETISSPLPLFKKTKPYQHIPFQYSLHIQREDEVSEATIEHKSFLAEGTMETDPRLPFINSLLSAMGTTGSIIVYSSFEQNVLEGIARDFPEYDEQIKALITRLVDLMQPFAAKAYYMSEMQGSYSIKKVLPALVPECASSYKELAIGEGGTASTTFFQMMQGTYTGNVQKARKDLEDYCKLDTWAMVKVLEKVKQVAYSTSPIYPPSIVFNTPIPIQSTAATGGEEEVVVTPKKTRGKKKAAVESPEADSSVAVSEEVATPKKRTPRAKKTATPIATTTTTTTSVDALTAEMTSVAITATSASSDSAPSTPESPSSSSTSTSTSTTEASTPAKPARKPRAKKAATVAASPATATIITSTTSSTETVPVSPASSGTDVFAITPASGERLVNVYEIIPKKKTKSSSTALELEG